MPGSTLSNHSKSCKAVLKKVVCNTLCNTAIQRTSKTREKTRKTKKKTSSKSTHYKFESCVARYKKWVDLYTIYTNC